MNELLLVVLAYLIGSVPTSVWVSRYFFDIDIRNYGSGNAGATNTYRILGSKWGTFVMIVDMLKGVIATSLYVLLPHYMHNDLHRTNFMIGLGMAAILGHIFPVWAGFKGGKGVATALGIMLFVLPWLAALLFIAAWVFVVAFTRQPFFASLASMVLVLSYLGVHGSVEQALLICAITAWLLFRHQANITVLLKKFNS